MSQLYSLRCSRVSCCLSLAVARRYLVVKFTLVLQGFILAAFGKGLNNLMVCLSLAGVSALNAGPWILVEDLSSVYNDVELERGAVKHAHKKRKLAEGRDKTMVRAEMNSMFRLIFVNAAQEGLRVRL